MVKPAGESLMLSQQDIELQARAFLSLYGRACGDMAYLFESWVRSKDFETDDLNLIWQEVKNGKGNT